MRTTSNLIFHTFIGLEVEILCSGMRNCQGLRGRVVNETKNLLVIETPKGEKRIPKGGCTFRFFLDDDTTMDVLGKTIAFRPEERAKKLL